MARLLSCAPPPQGILRWQPKWQWLRKHLITECLMQGMSSGPARDSHWRRESGTLFDDAIWSPTRYGMAIDGVSGGTGATNLTAHQVRTIHNQKFAQELVAHITISTHFGQPREALQGMITWGNVNSHHRNFYVNQGRYQFRLFEDGGTVRFVQSTNRFPASGDYVHLFAGTNAGSSAGSMSLYIDGIFQQSFAIINGGLQLGNPAAVMLYGYNGSNNVASASRIMLFRLWDQMFDAPLIKLLALDPWIMYRPVPHLDFLNFDPPTRIAGPIRATHHSDEIEVGEFANDAPIATKV